VVTVPNSPAPPPRVIVRAAQIPAARAWEDASALDENRQLAAQIYAEAADVSDLVVFPELNLSGYIPLKGYDQTRKQRLYELAKRCADDHLLTLARGTSGRRAAMVVGLMEPSQMRNEMYNSVVLLEDGEIRAVHRKMHLPVEENHYFVPGADVTVVDCRAGRVSLAICYDLVFPEVARLAALRGAQLLVVPSNWAAIANLQLYGEIFPIARALEEQLHVMFVNGVGDITVRGHVLSLFGRSRIVAATGRLLAEAGDDQAVIEATLTADDLDESAATFPVLRDRRPDAYHDLVAEPTRFSALAPAGRTGGSNDDIH
jgi:predicted amidohydrolase